VLAGISVVVSSFSVHAQWLASQNAYNISAPSLIFFIVAYTVWNWNFVLQNFSQKIAYYHLAVLASPLVFCLATLNPGLWLIMRASSLEIAVSLEIQQRSKIERFLSSHPMKKMIQKIETSNEQLLLSFLVIICSAASIFLTS